MLTSGSHFGQYHVLSRVGQGTQGTVYKAVDTRLDRQVALKVINEELADSADFRSSLANEARKAAQIDSPYVVKVWEYAEIDDSPFISYEFVTGEEFRQACNNLTVEQKLTLARKVGAGLQSVHARDVIHRDLKPENIRITTDGDPKILDFGLASTQHGHSVDSYGEIEGTIAYASPEQLSAEPISYSSDLFSFGIVLYELFTGRRPFEGDQTASVMYALLYEDPVGPQEIDPDLPEWLCDLIIHLLQKQTEDRPASMGEVIEAIDRNLVSDQPGLVAVGISRRSRTVTVVDLKNLSGDKSWDYFCLGFTDDVIEQYLVPEGPLGGDSVFYWRVRAYDGAEWSEFSRTFAICIAGDGCCQGIRGDVDGGGSVDVGDLTYLVAYLFQAGPPPPCLTEGDADGSGAIDVGDLTFMVAYLFQGGTAPAPCW